MAHLMPQLKQQFLDDNGRPLAGGKVYTYQAGTSTPLATYQDKTEGVANDNPIILDANGEADIWLGASTYKIVIQDANDVTIRTVDGVAHQNVGSITTGMLADGVLSADSAGRSKMADGFLGADAVSRAKMANGFLSADSVGRAKMADGYLTEVKLASGFQAPDVADNSISTVKLQNGAVTPGKLATPNWQITNQIAVQSVTTGGPVDIPGLSVQLTTTGRPVWVGLYATGGGHIFVGASTYGAFYLLRQSSPGVFVELFNTTITFGTAAGMVPPSAIWTISDTPAGTWTFKAAFGRNSGANSVQIFGARLVAYEL